MNVAERVRGLPGLPELLPALDGLARAHLVGGAVRDMLRGAESVDLDIAVEGSAVRCWCKRSMASSAVAWCARGWK